MLKVMLDRHILYVLMGVMTVLGIISKGIVSAALKRLVRAAGNMGKSTHPFMRLVRAKFEHACMVSETVENVGAFVDKYLYEYRTVGMKLHSWRRMELAMSGLCLLLGAAGAAMEYSVYGMQEMVIRYAGIGAFLAVFLYVIHKITDEGYRLEAVRNYMVDYLENVCLHRYEKAYQKEIQVMSPEAPAHVAEFGEVREEEPQEKEKAPVEEPIRPRPGKEVPSPRTAPEVEPPVMPETPTRIQAASDRKNEEKKEKKENPEREVLIRQILEEFMA